MKVLFLARSTLYSVYGGDTVQIEATARYLEKLGVQVDIRLCHEKIDYRPYDLLHIFNVIRPADALRHVRKSRKPYVLSTIFVDFSEYTRHHATDAVALLNRLLSPDQMEYAKVIARRIRNGEKIQSPEYLYMGHRKAVQALARGAYMLLPNSANEYRRFVAAYGIERPYHVVHNGIDTAVFHIPEDAFMAKRDEHHVLCVARIEGKKNQLNLIKALSGTDFQLKIIGKPAPNHLKYYETCKAIAGSNVDFISFTPQEQLVQYYSQAKVHVLPSWNETCGLSSLEAAYAGCNLVITDKGDTEEYFGQEAWYCDPDNPESIYKAIARAAVSPVRSKLREKISSTYNWQEAAQQTLKAYMLVLSNYHTNV